MVPFIGLHLFTTLNIKWTAILYNALAWPFLLVVIYKAVPSESSGEQLQTSTILALFLFFILLVILDVVLVFSKEKLVSLSFKGLYYSIGAFFAAFFASILFNPFHLTNLTHTFVISVSKNAERWRDIHEWHPAFDWSNPVGTAVPFLIMYIIIWLVFFSWVISRFVASDPESKSIKRSKRNPNSYEWPKMNIAMIIIAALTIYMAVRSRRFIPIAGIAGCPVIAMLLTEVIKAVSAKLNFLNGRGFVIPKMSKNLQHSFIIVGALLIAYFGTWWALKFKSVYLDPWPNDTKYSSVFMRMTASDAKPFYAMKFIRDNKLKGDMFNYWTEGGFIAWGEKPDPNGFTPLKLFMDGRAQAAYNRKYFDIWTNILAGGYVTRDILMAARARGEEVTDEELAKIGDFMNKELTDRNVWVFLMPATIYNDPEKPSSYYTFKALEAHPDWRLVFENDRQKMLVDIKTTQGRQLFEGILSGETKFPDEFHQNLMRAHVLLTYGHSLNDLNQGLDCAEKAFDAHQCPIAMMEIIANATRYTELLPKVYDFCSKYSDNFDKNRGTFIKEDGYRLKAEAARLANFHLASVASAQKNDTLKKAYSTRRDFCLNELRRINNDKRW